MPTAFSLQVPNLSHKTMMNFDHEPFRLAFRVETEQRPCTNVVKIYVTTAEDEDKDLKVSDITGFAIFTWNFRVNTHPDSVLTKISDTISSGPHVRRSLIKPLTFGTEGRPECHRIWQANLTEFDSIHPTDILNIPLELIIHVDKITFAI